MLAEGMRVICIDTVQTGDVANLAHLKRDAGFTIIPADVIDSLPAQQIPKQLDSIFNLTWAASPDRYQAAPEHMMLTNVLGSRNLLQSAERCNARFLLASTSEVYGDPKVHPQVASHSSNVNSTGPVPAMMKANGRPKP
jgi:UDP-glucuronate decarboxylase